MEMCLWHAACPAMRMAAGQFFFLQMYVALWQCPVTPLGRKQKGFESMRAQAASLHIQSNSNLSLMLGQWKPQPTHK